MHATTITILADAAPGGGAAAPAGGGDTGAGFTPMIVLGLTFLIIWIFLIRPANKQEKERKKAIYLIKKGDDVTFSGGILGTVASIKEKTAGTPGDNDEVTVKVLDSKLRILRSAIYAITPASDDGKEPATT